MNGPKEERTGGSVERGRDPVTLDSRGAEALARGFARALLGGDADAAASYFSAAAHILTPDGTEIAGRRQIAEVLGQLTSSSQQLEIRIGRVLVCGPVALCTQFWRRRSPRSGPGAFEHSSTARLVLLRDAGRWQIVIASPWE